MNDETTPDPAAAKTALAEARALISAAEHTPNQERFRQLMSWARETLQPFAEHGDVDAQWLLGSIPEAGDGDDDDEYDPEEHIRRYVAEARRLAEAGSASAMFFLACELYHDDATSAESTGWYRRAAELGHAHAQWCYGLNLLNGRGVDADRAHGLRWIEAAAHGKFEGAIRFMSQARAEGTYGYAKDEAESSLWWARLNDKDLIRY